MKKKLVIITILYLLLDILTKRLALKYFTNLAIIPEFLSFTLAKNTGAAFLFQLTLNTTLYTFYLEDFIFKEDEVFF